jgi:hypothetical protein
MGTLDLFEGCPKKANPSDFVLVTHFKETTGIYQPKDPFRRAAPNLLPIR